MKQQIDQSLNFNTIKRSTACQAMPPPVAKSMQEIPRAPIVSNLPCPEIRNQRNITINDTENFQ